MDYKFLPVLHSERPKQSCTEPESFVRGGPNLITFFFSWWEIEDPNTALIVPSPALQPNAIVKWCFADGHHDGPTLNADFQGILTSIAKKPYIFVFLKGGGGGGGEGGPDPLSPIWIRPWQCSFFSMCNRGNEAQVDLTPLLPPRCLKGPLL